MSLRYNTMTAIELIKKWEGWRSVAYKCPAGVWTIGYGRTHGVKEGDETTREIEEKWLKDKIEELRVKIAESVKPIILTPNQMDALISFVYNVGFTAFQRSTLRKRILMHDFEGAQQEFHRWKYAKGKVLRGLVRRRASEAAVFGGETTN